VPSSNQVMLFGLPLCRVGNVKLFFHALPHVPFLARQELLAGDQDRARRPKTWDLCWRRRHSAG